MEFTDGNGIPKCTMGSDIYDEDGDYIALKLTNDEVHDCEGNEDDDDNELPDDGWVDAECGDLNGCPLVHDCGRSGTHEFPDSPFMSDKGKDSASYLWRECAVDGKDDEGFHPNDYITRAEALKISMILFELMEDCGDENPFTDVSEHDWYYDYVVCGVRYGVVSTNEEEFRPDDYAIFAEAAKFAVAPAAEAGVIKIKHPDEGHFPEIPEDHWAYEYAETLYAYSALVDDPEDIDPDDRVVRETYAIMVASLSPCFCWNINCENGCECSQKDFACVDPDDNGGGTGGEDDDDDDDSAADDDESDDDHSGDDDDSDDDDDTIPGDDDDDDCFVRVYDPAMVWVDNYDYLYMDTDEISGEIVFIFALVGGGEVCYKNDTGRHCQQASPCSSYYPSGDISFHAWSPISGSEEYPTYPDPDEGSFIEYGGYCGYLPGNYNFAPE